MKTREDYMKELESCKSMMANDYTFPEYASALCEFQETVCKLIAGNNYHENMRFEECLFMMESSFRNMNLSYNQIARNGITSLKKLEKEMAITMSGIKGEQRIAKTLNMLNRNNTHIFRNVYITDGNEQTELDAVVLTDNGVLILEMKKVSSDVTLTEDGRLIRNGCECYDDIPLCEKMNIKRKLLKNHLEKALTARSISIPVKVDSMIVFTSRNFINVHDMYGKERYCFQSTLNKKIEAYDGNVNYGTQELDNLKVILSETENNVKRFASELNYNEIRNNIADALVLLNGTISNEKVDASMSSNAKTDNKDAKGSAKYVDEYFAFGSKSSRLIHYVAASLAGILILGSSVASQYTHRI